MNIRGFVRFSLNDFPGKMCCVLFVGDCNFRCPYCHNPHLVFDPESQPRIEESQILNFLSGRIGKLDGIVVSGGEPSLRGGFPHFADAVKKMGFLLKLDTNGSNPEFVIRNHQKARLDAIGVDYKASVPRYNHITHSKIPDLAERVHRTIKYAVEHGLSIDVRTTVHKSLLSTNELRMMREELDSLGIRCWTLQQFHPVEIIDDELNSKPTYSDTELVEIARSLGKDTRVRGLRGVFIDEYA
ncbi:MAG: anaerobic ribonucleoside-triphosphate reductase activating protein [Lentisphaerae bacterium GWF2_52_8]|nr:MAG: anaerobic ribonucleoside-triphosphate reductase activating protein [Lentisphaerae bacterium GWF2_52_8]